MIIQGKYVIPPTIAEVFDMHADDIGSKLRVCMTGYIKTYDSVKRTASVILGENLVLKDGTVVVIKYPLLDVPVFTLQGGGIHVGLPIKAADTSPDGKGDECLLIFADYNIDAWHAHGGQQTPLDARQHDISDAFAFVGPNSMANQILTALTATEGGLSSAAAKVAIDKTTQLITIAKGAETLKAIINDTITQIMNVNTGIVQDIAIVPNAGAAATTANTQLALILTRLAALLY